MRCEMSHKNDAKSRPALVTRVDIATFAGLAVLNALAAIWCAIDDKIWWTLAAAFASGIMTGFFMCRRTLINADAVYAETSRIIQEDTRHMKQRIEALMRR